MPKIPRKEPARISSPSCCLNHLPFPLALGKFSITLFVQISNSMHPQYYFFLYVLALLSVPKLMVAFTPWESIHQTIHTYPLAIDSKDFAMLSKVTNLQIFVLRAFNRVMALYFFAQRHCSFHHSSKVLLNRSSHPMPPPTTQVISRTSMAFQQSRPVSQHRLPMSTPSTSSAPRSSTSTAIATMPILPPTSKPVFLAYPTLLALWYTSMDTILTTLRELLKAGVFPRGSWCFRGRVMLVI